MKRAAASASTWLKSIGRGQTERDHEIIPRDPTFTNNTTEDDSDDENWKSKIEINEMTVMTLKATLHSTQFELEASKQVNSTLNEELSKCRAEIGRLKSISRNEVSTKQINYLFRKKADEHPLLTQFIFSILIGPFSMILTTNPPPQLCQKFLRRVPLLVQLLEACQIVKRSADIILLRAL